MAMSTRDDRKKLGRLAESEQARLDEQARARVFAHVRAVGPKVVRRARVQRIVVRAAAGVAALALVVLGVRSLDVPDGSPEVGAPVVAANAPLDCFDYPAVQSDFAGSEGRQRLDLGERALFVASAKSKVRVITLEPCRTEVELLAGRVSVHARDLGGGALVVNTPHGDVAVRGTVFAVETRDGKTWVDVAEGRVELTERSGRKTRVVEAFRAETSGETTATSELEEQDVGKVLREVGLDDTVELAELEDVAPDDDDVVEERHAPTVRKRSRKYQRRRRLAAKRRRLRRAKRQAARGTHQPGDSIVQPAVEVDLPPIVKPEPPPLSAGELIRRGDSLRRLGRVGEARRAYLRAGELVDQPDSEAAWLKLARLDLGRGVPADARTALAKHRRLYPKGELAPEAAWIGVDIEIASGNLDKAEDLAEELTERWPRTAFGKKARQWLERRD